MRVLVVEDEVRMAGLLKRALARRDERSRPVILAEGDLSLDPAAKRAWRAGTELRLTPKEFALLEFFLAHPGQVLTRCSPSAAGCSPAAWLQPS